MPDIDSNFLAHFRELHLLPRTVYAIGAALFITELFTKNVALVRQPDGAWKIGRVVGVVDSA